jgi:hypothetical protein
MAELRGLVASHGRRERAYWNGMEAHFGIDLRADTASDGLLSESDLTETLM